MKISLRQVLADGLKSGTVAALGSAALMAVRGQMENGNAVAPINAVSHIAWGDEAYECDQIDGKHSLVGLAINDTAMITWGVIFEGLRAVSGSRGHLPKTLTCATVLSVLAWVLDYRIVPPRLTPGVEAHLSKRSIVLLYIGLALALSASAMWRDRDES